MFLFDYDKINWFKNVLLWLWRSMLSVKHTISVSECLKKTSGWVNVAMAGHICGRHVTSGVFSFHATLYLYSISEGIANPLLLLTFHDVSRSTVDIFTTSQRFSEWLVLALRPAGLSIDERHLNASCNWWEGDHNYTFFLNCVIWTTDVTSFSLLFPNSVICQWTCSSVESHLPRLIPVIVS